MLKKILLLALLPAIAFAEELPAPVKAIEKQGITIIKTFDAPGGMKGYLGKYQDMGVTIYLTQMVSTLSLVTCTTRKVKT